MISRLCPRLTKFTLFVAARLPPARISASPSSSSFAILLCPCFLSPYKHSHAEAIAFLRMLEQFKIPRVVESRGKNLLEKLLALQGDSIKSDGPPSFEETDDETGTAASGKDEPVSSPEPVKAATTTAPRKEVYSPTRQGSVVSQLVSHLEEVDAEAKKEQDRATVKRAGDEKGEEKPSEEPAEEPAKAEDAPASDSELKPERRGSSASSVDAEALDKSSTETHKLRGSTLAAVGAGLGSGLGKLFKGKKKKDRDRDASPCPTVEEPVEESPLPDDPDAKIQAYLDHQVEEKKKKKKKAVKQWVRRVVKVKEDELLVDEETMSLRGCTVGAVEAEPCQFEVYSHPEHKQVVLRAASSEEQGEWVKVLNEVITECKSPELEPEQPSECEGM